MSNYTMAQETESWEFAKTRIFEFDSIIRESGHRIATANQYGKVRFICPPDEIDGHQRKTKSSQGSTTVNCDIFILAAAMHASRSRWLRRELADRLSELSEQDGGVTIILPKGASSEDLKILIDSLTAWTPLDTSRLKTITEIGIGKDLGLHKLLANDSNDGRKDIDDIDKENENPKKRSGNDFDIDYDSNVSSTERLCNQAKNSEHNANGTSHNCSICKKSFSQRKLLNRHIRTTHSEHNPNTCEVGTSPKFYKYQYSYCLYTPSLQYFVRFKIGDIKKFCLVLRLVDVGVAARQSSLFI